MGDEPNLESAHQFVKLPAVKLGVQASGRWPQAGWMTYLWNEVIFPTKLTFFLMPENSIDSKSAEKWKKEICDVGFLGDDIQYEKCQDELCLTSWPFG